jgi:Domain of unknown function (DUF4260)
MTTTSAVGGRLSSFEALPLSVRSILRIEGFAVAAVSAVLYARSGASWWLFAALWLAPDLSMLGYLAGPCRGARIYNAFHTYTLPIVLGLLAVTTHASALVPYALIWVNHIGIDRGLGYGLKFSQGFGWTHLGIRGRAGLESTRGGCSESQTQQ